MNNNIYLLKIKKEMFHLLELDNYINTIIFF